MQTMLGVIWARRKKQFILARTTGDFHLEIFYLGLAPRISTSLGSTYKLLAVKFTLLALLIADINYLVLLSLV